MTFGVASSVPNSGHPRFSSRSPPYAAAVRFVFTAYVLLIAAGLALYIGIGITQP
jgi:hypothetical protein